MPKRSLVKPERYADLVRESLGVAPNEMVPLRYRLEGETLFREREKARRRVTSKKAWAAERERVHANFLAALGFLPAEILMPSSRPQGITVLLDEIDRLILEHFPYAYRDVADTDIYAAPADGFVHGILAHDTDLMDLLRLHYRGSMIVRNPLDANLFPRKT